MDKKYLLVAAAAVVAYLFYVKQVAPAAPGTPSKVMTTNNQVTNSTQQAQTGTTPHGDII
jgi:hypothetical protein